MPNDRQDRIVNALVSDPYIWRADCHPLPDGPIEVWCYGPEDVLQSIRTIHEDGRMDVRPGFRLTTNTKIGDPE